MALRSKGVEREVERYDVLRRRPEIERSPVAVASQRLPVGHPYAQRRLPGTGVVERFAQRFGLEVPDPSAAGAFTPYSYPAGGSQTVATVATATFGRSLRADAQVPACRC